MNFLLANVVFYDAVNIAHDVIIKAEKYLKIANGNGNKQQK